MLSNKKSYKYFLSSKHHKLQLVKTVTPIYLSTPNKENVLAVAIHISSYEVSVAKRNLWKYILLI